MTHYYLYWVERYRKWSNGDFSQSKIEQFIEELRAQGKIGAAYVAAYAIIWFLKNIRKTEIEIRNIPPLEQKIPEVLEHEEANKLIDTTCLYDIRAGTIIALLYDTGLRISEMLNLNAGDVDFKKKMIFVRKRKGTNLAQYIPFGKKCAIILMHYMRVYAGEDNNSPLFTGNNGRMSIYTAERIVRDWGKRVLEKRVHPHMLRHSCAIRLRETGADFIDISDLLGHQNLQTTRIYARMTPSIALKKYKSPLDGV